jgi:hypothetical protein
LNSFDAMKTKSKIDWRARLNGEKTLQINRLGRAFADMPMGATMVIVTPRMVDEFVRAIPVGRIFDQKTVRKHLAANHKADCACPVTMGISLRVVAEAAYEKLIGGADLSEITPFWRAVDPKSDLAGKLACGFDFIEGRRNEEFGRETPPNEKKKTGKQSR